MDEKQKEIKTKSASGIWEWIFWILLAFAVIAVFIASQSIIWYALTGKPAPKTDSVTVPDTGIPEYGTTGDVSPIRDHISPGSNTTSPSPNTW